MASRDDITVLWHLSPRIITVASPSVEVTIQDLHDTLRDLEDEPSALIYPSIITTAGKEELGGSVTVGLTATLLDAQLSFEQRSTQLTTGTATGGSATTLVDAGADFVALGVVRGDIVQNHTDDSQATVHTVSTTSLLLTPLAGGTADVFVVTDVYAIWHVIQCNVSGGNLVAVDALDVELDPIFPTAFTQVVRTSSSSATALGLTSLEAGSFEGVVAIDIGSVFTGIEFPVGTRAAPVNNLSDAHDIAEARGLTTILVMASMTLTGIAMNDGYRFTSDNPGTVTVTIDPSMGIANAVFENITVEGTLDGNNVFRQCHILDISYVQGFIFQCAFSGEITLTAGAQASLLDCYSNVAGGGLGQTAALNAGGNGSLALRNYSGGINITNVTGGGDISMDFSSGRCIIENSCTGGDIYARGICDVTDSSAGTTVYDQTITRQAAKIKADTSLIPGQM